MKNKLNKTLGIIAGSLGGLLLVFIAVLLLTGSSISDIFNFSKLFNKTEAQTTASLQ